MVEMISMDSYEFDASTMTTPPGTQIHFLVKKFHIDRSRGV